MTTDQVEFTADELLADHEHLQPLIAHGVRCHGGLTEDGTYVSPRSRFRAGAIDAWEAQRVARSGTAPLHLPLDTWPASFPNVEQSKLLLRNGVPGPTISSLTRIGTVEGFGAMMRVLPQPDLQPLFVDDIRGTATDHIRKGLFEAHARDEAGHEDQAGHDRMWFAARDLAFDDPVTEDETARMLERMQITPPPAKGDADARAAIVERARTNRVLPGDIDLVLEMVLSRMIGLLFIEIQAFHTFDWAEQVLADTELCAGEGEAARLVGYIRADETPHVGYLKVALSEMRDWTWRGTAGVTYDGAEMVGLLWQKALDESRFLRRADILRVALDEIEHALAGRADAADLFDELLTLGSVVRQPDGTYVEQTADGGEVRVT